MRRLAVSAIVLNLLAILALFLFLYARPFIAQEAAWSNNSYLNSAGVYREDRLSKLFPELSPTVMGSYLAGPPLEALSNTTVASLVLSSLSLFVWAFAEHSTRVEKEKMRSSTAVAIALVFFMGGVAYLLSSFVYPGISAGGACLRYTELDRAEVIDEAILEANFPILATNPRGLVAKQVAASAISGVREASLIGMALCGLNWILWTWFAFSAWKRDHAIPHGGTIAA